LAEKLIDLFNTQGPRPMTISLYDAIIPSNRQILASMLKLLDKAEAHCTQHGIAPETLIQAKLADDMLPFAYQVKSTVTHSLGAIEGVRKGLFVPEMTPPPSSFADLRAYVSNAHAALGDITPAEMTSFLGRDTRFEVSARNFRVDFTAENFLLSFSQPNFYFHATAAYSILRMKGVALGKIDFLGPLRVKS
jgi:uncharacterized protein